MNRKSERSAATGSLLDTVPEEVPSGSVRSESQTVRILSGAE